MPSAEHEVLIDRLVERGGYTRGQGFAGAMRRLIPDHDPVGFTIQVRPDAYLIDRENWTVVAAEVEVAHRVSHEKMGRYCDLNWLLDYYGWDLVLLVINRFGKAAGIDMHMAAAERVVEEVKAAA